MHNLLSNKTFTHFFDQLGYGFILLMGLAITSSVAGTSITTGVIALCFLLSGRWSEKKKLLKHPLVITSLLLFFVIALGNVYSHAPLERSFFITFSNRKLLFIWIIMSFIHTHNRQKKALLWFLFGITINLIISLLNYYILGPKAAIQFSGANFPAPMGSSATALFFILLYCYCFLFAKHISSKKKRYIIIFIGIVAVFAEMALNTSRTGYLLTFALLLYVSWQRFHLKGALIAGLTALFLAVTLYHIAPLFHTRSKAAIENSLNFVKHSNIHSSAGIRLSGYLGCLELISNKPLLGYGTGALTTVYSKTTQQAFRHKKSPDFLIYDEPSNQYLLFWVENGLPGLLLFVAFLFFMYQCSQGLSPPLNQFARLLSITVILACFTCSWLRSNNTGYTLMYLIAILYPCLTQQNHPQEKAT